MVTCSHLTGDTRSSEPVSVSHNLSGSQARYNPTSSHALIHSPRILKFENFRYLKTGFDVFFDVTIARLNGREVSFLGRVRAWDGLWYDMRHWFGFASSPRSGHKGCKSDIT